MSEAYNVNQLRKFKKNLEEELNKSRESVKALKEEDKSLDKKIAELQKKSSKLAKDLVKALENNKKQNSQEICKLVEGQYHMEERLKAVTQRIESPDPTGYIAEQVKEMFEAFTAHVKIYERKYGLAISTEFKVKHEERPKTMKNLSWNEPTGIVEIYTLEPDNPQHIVIVKSKDFPYNHMMLYTQKEDDEKITLTNWFIKYLKAFKKELFKVFKEQFNHESFKLTVDEKNNSFTLELV